MTGFRVLPEELAAQAAELSCLAGELQAAGAPIADASGAAARTPAQDALAQAASAWVQLLRQYGSATSALATAVGQAGESYAATDEGVVPDV